MSRAHGSVKGKATCIYISDAGKEAMRELAMRLGTSMSAAFELAVCTALDAARRGDIDARVAPTVQVEAQDLLVALKGTLASLQSQAKSPEQIEAEARAAEATKRGRDARAAYDTRLEELRQQLQAIRAAKGAGGNGGHGGLEQ